MEKDRKQYNNYWGISLFSIPGKVYPKYCTLKKSWRIPLEFLFWPQHYRLNFHSPANLLEFIGISKRLPFLFFWPRKI